jgi:uncharacterized RDD family membrane protein YckC
MADVIQIDLKKMQYAGFWVRLVACFIDGLLFIPFTFFYYALRAISWNMAAIIQIPFFLLWPLYNIYSLGHWGQTIGKKVAHIKVVLLDRSPVGYKQAFLRHVVDLFLAILVQCSLFVALFSVSKDAFDISGWREVNRLLYDATPFWGFWAQHAVSIWFLSEMVVLLFNEKKRAIHDFIAGTLVIRTNK